MTRASRTDDAGRAYAGSQRQMQSYATEHQPVLSAAVATALTAAGCSVEDLKWVSPLESKGFAEPRDAAFLEALELAHHQERLSEFWPSGGPVWDGLALGHPGPVAVLVEAKSYPGEMFGTGCKASEGLSRDLISASLQTCRAWSGARGDANWMGRLYQYANRLAHVYFLREVCRTEAWLINLCFLDDPRSPTSLRAWQHHSTSVRHELGFDKRRPPYALEVFLPAVLQGGTAGVV